MKKIIFTVVAIVVLAINYNNFNTSKNFKSFSISSASLLNKAYANPEEGRFSRYNEYQGTAYCSFRCYDDNGQAFVVAGTNVQYYTHCSTPGPYETCINGAKASACTGTCP